MSPDANGLDTKASYVAKTVEQTPKPENATSRQSLDGNSPRIQFNYVCKMEFVTIYKNKKNALTCLIVIRNQYTPSKGKTHIFLHVR